MGLAMSHYEFDTLVAIDNVIATAYTIGGLEITAVLHSESVIVRDPTGKRDFIFDGELSKEQLAQAMQQGLVDKQYQWQVCFQHKAIKQYVDIKINNITQQIRVISGMPLVEGKDTLHRLIDKTLTNLGGIDTFGRSQKKDNQDTNNQISPDNDFPIDIQKLIAIEKKATKVFCLFAPLYAILFAFMFIFSFPLPIIGWIMDYKYYLLALFAMIFIIVAGYMHFI